MRRACLLLWGLLSCTAAIAEKTEPDVIYVPTPQNVVEEMLRLAGIDGGDLLYDLGCGDGRIVVTAAKQYGARAVGIDIDPERIAESRASAKRNGVTDRVRFIQGDLFEADLSEATAVTLYLLTSLNMELRPKLLRELEPGTPVVSHVFGMGEWEADESVAVDSGVIYLWRVPADAHGAWEIRVTGEEDGGPIALSLEQRFQKLTGLAYAGGEHLAIEEGRMDGRGLELVLASMRDGSRQTLTGQVEGERMRGRLVAPDGSARDWVGWRRAGGDEAVVRWDGARLRGAGAR